MSSPISLHPLQPDLDAPARAPVWSPSRHQFPRPALYRRHSTVRLRERTNSVSPTQDVRRDAQTQTSPTRWVISDFTVAPWRDPAYWPSMEDHGAQYVAYIYEHAYGSPSNDYGTPPLQHISINRDHGYVSPSYEYPTTKHHERETESDDEDEFGRPSSTLLPVSHDFGSPSFDHLPTSHGWDVSRQNWKLECEYYERGVEWWGPDFDSSEGYTTTDGREETNPQDSEEEVDNLLFLEDPSIIDEQIKRAQVNVKRLMEKFERQQEDFEQRVKREREVDSENPSVGESRQPAKRIRSE
ncbi:hypothetical protein BKA62DRAFT_65446 [Auriculariales sp. MPI-PUGE-AT-0066]|nr:hypothetical protein BKA62DRAFT_65446 [Auriculariales sp. MPI-PUGE-AT-0066]